jgi:transposase
LACKTDKIDAQALAELSFRDLVPAIGLPTPELRAERERVRYRMHLVTHRSILKNRIHSALIAFGYHCPVSDLFGAGRQLLQKMDFPEPWKGNVTASLELIDDLNHRIDQIARQLKRAGADRAYVPLLMTAPGGRLDQRLHHRLENSATSTASPPRPSWSATAACVPASNSPALSTPAARSRRPDRDTCAGG